MAGIKAMKTIIAYLIYISFVGCQHNETDKAQKYLRVHKALLQDSCFKQFLGYQIIPREDYYYFVMIDRPRLTIFPEYNWLHKVEVSKKDAMELRDSLVKYYPNTFEEEQRGILGTIGTLISIMKDNGIQCAYGWAPLNADSSGYYIEFLLSGNESLRYDSQKWKTGFRRETTVTRIDSSWVYLVDEALK
jgi:hypothetical protein